ncbi:hypothetical protein K445DRAFT_25262 [Daldinia sp. EC12]|nr:hypothetical protein K445DRAFT_25262 [Daldinia sp. EC12]
MSFLDLVGGLLRVLPLQARGSTDRVREAGGGPSGADFFVAELELQSCPANPQPPPTCSIPHNSDIIKSHTHILHIQLPELPEPALLYTGRGITSPPLLVLHPIDSVSSFSSGSNTTRSRSDGSINSSEEGTGGEIRLRLHRNDTVDRKAAKKQRESQLCWREYWG